MANQLHPQNLSLEFVKVKLKLDAQAKQKKGMTVACNPDCGHLQSFGAFVFALFFTSARTGSSSPW
ncbi:MAG: hypothetical protein METHAR1v1_580004 [Methanothrix sp.]|nr:MAG: hypothetical protein METHAR1v1_580004 [Methanothrix sp.]